MGSNPILTTIINSIINHFKSIKKMGKSLKAGKAQNDFRKDGADEPSAKRRMTPFSKKDRI